MKYSKQRELIYQWVCEHPVHPSANEVYVQLKQKHPALSLATVYRNLNLLATHGMLQKISVPQGRDRFDANVKKHYHAVCESCGEIYDVSLPGLECLEQTLSDELQFQVRHHQLFVSGVCCQCQNTNTTKKET